MMVKFMYVKPPLLLFSGYPFLKMFGMMPRTGLILCSDMTADLLLVMVT